MHQVSLILARHNIRPIDNEANAYLKSLRQLVLKLQSIQT